MNDELVTKSSVQANVFFLILLHAVVVLFGCVIWLCYLVVLFGCFSENIWVYFERKKYTEKLKMI